MTAYWIVTVIGVVAAAVIAWLLASSRLKSKLAGSESTIENLKAELEPILGDVEVPHLHSWTKGRAHWTTYYDADTAAMIGEWAAEDFERFGYDRDI